MKYLIGLYGKSNIGKTEAIRLVFELIKEKYPDLKYDPDYQPILSNDGDISVIVIVNGIKIGIESQGDPNSRIFVSIPIFINLNCDVILCATRTRGATVQIIEGLKNDFQINWIEKKQVDDSKLQFAENKKSAICIAEKIIEHLNVLKLK